MAKNIVALFFLTRCIEAVLEDVSVRRTFDTLSH